MEGSSKFRQNSGFSKTCFWAGICMNFQSSVWSRSILGSKWFEGSVCQRQCSRTVIPMLFSGAVPSWLFTIFVWKVLWGTSILALNASLERSQNDLQRLSPLRPFWVQNTCKGSVPSTNAVFSAINGSEEGSRKRNPKVPPTCPDFFEGSSFLHLIGFSRLSNQAF